MNDLPLMDEEIMLGFGVTRGHPYYKEIQCLLSMSFIIEMTGKALTPIPNRTKYIDNATLAALDDYIQVFSDMAQTIQESRE